METKFIEAGGIQVGYMEKNREQEQLVFFIHGNSGSKRTWIKQFKDPLFDPFHLVAFDIPGCGNLAD
ncbi:MAG: alpha/beta hydrolase [Chitinophagaceae bacterium]|nr:alpha/beta hydrolase [Chitinophagaceae bacterium]